MVDTEYWAAARRWAWRKSSYFKYAGAIVALVVWIALCVVSAKRPDVVDLESLTKDLPKLIATIVVTTILAFGEFLVRLLFEAPRALYAEAVHQIRQLEKQLELDPVEESKRALVREKLKDSDQSALELVRRVWHRIEPGVSMLGYPEKDARVITFELVTCGAMIRKHNSEDPFGRKDTFFVPDEYRRAVDAILREHGI